MPFARAEDGSLLQLNTDSDNWAALQAFCDAHHSVLLPDGRYPISKTLNAKNAGFELSGKGMEATTLLLNAETNGPVVGWGANGLWAGSSGYGQADFVKLSRMTLETQSTLSTNSKCLWIVNGDDATLRKVRAKGAVYEGFVNGSNVKRTSCYDIEAVECGNGDAVLFPRTTAGINMTGIDQLIDGFRTINCGQGVECGNTRETFRRGLITDDGSHPLGPRLGITIGNSVYGVYQTTIEQCTVSGYATAVSCTNVNGRLAAVTVKNNRLYGAFEFTGGALNNVVPHPDQGPTTEGSFLIDNEIVMDTLGNGPVLYNAGNVNNGGLFGREPMTIARNTIRILNEVAYTTPVFGYAGRIDGTQLLYGNFVTGLATYPSRGDVQSFTFGANGAVAGFPALSYYSNIAFDGFNKSRAWKMNIEGA